jgi:glucosamine--fructose-6-phosphate aminotransferase (isomerizing)
MCGIVGYVGTQPLLPLLVESLQQLEYRGYDSAGVSFFNPTTGRIETHKATGKLVNLKNLVQNHPAYQPLPNAPVQVGIGHIRWATHGSPTQLNAHPHTSQNGLVTLVHNGIIDNFSVLKEALLAKGYVFHSETDSEVVAHLLEDLLKQGHTMPQALVQLQAQLEGAYALTILHANEPDTLYALRHKAPLVVGVGQAAGEFWVASDVVALVSHTNQVLYLDDGQMVSLSHGASGLTLYNAAGEVLTPTLERIQTGPLTIDKQGYKHFMLKEIYEQPSVLRRVLGQRLLGPAAPIALFNESKFAPEAQTGQPPAPIAPLLQGVQRLVILGCGTSYNAGLVAKYFMEGLVGLPIEVESAGEYRYRNGVVTPQTLVVAISQSGETADTLEALRKAKSGGCKTLVLTNRPDSLMAREADAVLDVRAGVEVSVCATKSFVAQMATLFLLGMYWAEQLNSASMELLTTLKEELVRLPVLMEQTLAHTEPCQRLATTYGSTRSMLFMARGIQYPAVLEGALKLKEISYIHAEAYSGAELKHGPIALLDEHMPVLAVLAQGPVFEKMLANCQEAKARHAKVVALTNAPLGAEQSTLFDAVVEYPLCHELLSPLLSSLPLQLLAYYTAEYLGKDVDQPRNLAKSVTVE